MQFKPAPDEALLAHPLEQSEQRVPKAVDIGKHDWLLMLLELRPGQLLHELLEGSKSAGEGNERIRADEHQMLALMHVVDHDELVRFEKHVLALAEEGGDDAGD